MKRGDGLVLKVILGAILLGFGTFLLLQSNRNIHGVARAAGDSYTGTWTAAQLYQLNYTGNTGSAVPVGAIGVQQWNVSYVDASSNPIASEVWKAPDAATIHFDYSSTVGNNGCRTTYDATLWLGGCYSALENSGSYHYSLTLVAPNNNPKTPFFTTNTTSGLSSQGGASFCNVSGISAFGCITTTGMYGFVHTGPGNPTGNEIVRAGVMMPLQWTVTGTLY